MQSTKVLALGMSALIFSFAAATTIANAVAGQTMRVSVSSGGVPANGAVSSGVLSADGRYVVFMSAASNLVSGAGGGQVYRHDRSTGVTALVSVATNRGAGTGFSFQSTVSADGRYVAFSSFATDLVDGDTNGAQDVFVRDMVAGTTALVSTTSSGALANGGSSLSGLSGAREISDDGRYVAFLSAATNLVLVGNNGWPQVFVKDMSTGAVVRASVSNDGQTGNAASQAPVISGNGQVVAFQSAARNLSPLSDTTQVFVRDLIASTTTLESAGAAVVGAPSTNPALSFDGRYLAFESAAALHPRDADNGTPDIFLRDRLQDTTVLASLSDNKAGGAFSLSPSISGDGRWVGFSSLDDQLVGVTSDTNGLVDVFLYDRDNEAVTLVSLNDDGQQPTGVHPFIGSGGASVSSDGHFVLFGSNASSLVPSASTGSQLYVRSLVSSVAPTVNLAPAIDLPFSRNLDTPGTFTDPDPRESYTATVNYGDGTGTQTLALGPYDASPLAGGSFALRHTYASAGTYTVSVTVTDSNAGSTTGTMVVRVGAYSYQWLDPMSRMFVVGRNLPVKFTVDGPDGSSVLDRSVRVDVIDESGAVVAGPYVFGEQPSRSVTLSGGTYHVNVDTKDVAPGMYWLRVSFSSPTLNGEFTLSTNGTTSVLRNRVRD